MSADGEMTVINRDDALFGGLVSVFSVLCAVALSHAWEPPRLPDPPAPQNLAVHFSLQSPPSAPATTARQPIVVSKPASPTPHPKLKPKLEKVPPRPAPPAEYDSESTVPAPQIIESTATLDVSSMTPSSSAVTATASDALPPLPSAPPTTPPPSPDDDEPVNPFPVKPYGDTVVVAFKIDSDGHILDSRILIPSWNALADMSIRLAAQSNEAKSIRYTNINPPLQPGETRWIVLPHTWGTSANGNSLP